MQTRIILGLIPVVNPKREARAYVPNLRGSRVVRIKLPTLLVSLAIRYVDLLGGPKSVFRGHPEIAS